MKSGKTGAMCAVGIVVVGFVFFLAGCAEVENPPFAAAEIISSPPGAEVVNVKDNSILGTTPFKYAWETEAGKEEYIIVSLRKSGYEDTITTFFVNPRYDSDDAAMENPQVVEVTLDQSR